MDEKGVGGERGGGVSDDPRRQKLLYPDCLHAVGIHSRPLEGERRQLPSNPQTMFNDATCYVDV